jgi:hypothetical protein
MSESDWKPSGPELDPSGKLVGEAKRTVVARPVKAEPSPAVPSVESPTPGSQRSGWSETASPPVPEAAPYEDEAPAPKRSRAPVGAMVGVLVLLGLGGAMVWYGQSVIKSVTSKLSARLPTPPAQMLSVSSEPSGATVRINGSTVGQTPLFMDNLYPADREAKVEIVLKGHRTWTGTLRGGEPVHIEADLVKQ